MNPQGDTSRSDGSSQPNNAHTSNTTSNETHPRARVIAAFNRKQLDYVLEKEFQKRNILIKEFLTEPEQKTDIFKQELQSICNCLERLLPLSQESERKALADLRRKQESSRTLNSSTVSEEVRQELLEMEKYAAQKTRNRIRDQAQLRYFNGLLSFVTTVAEDGREGRWGWRFVPAPLSSGPAGFMRVELGLERFRGNGVEPVPRHACRVGFRDQEELLQLQARKADAFLENTKPSAAPMDEQPDNDAGPANEASKNASDYQIDSNERTWSTQPLTPEQIASMSFEDLAKEWRGGLDLILTEIRNIQSDDTLNSKQKIEAEHAHLTRVLTIGKEVYRKNLAEYSTAKSEEASSTGQDKWEIPGYMILLEGTNTGVRETLVNITKELKRCQETLDQINSGKDMDNMIGVSAGLEGENTFYLPGRGNEGMPSVLVTHYTDPETGEVRRNTTWFFPGGPQGVPGSFLSRSKDTAR